MWQSPREASLLLLLTWTFLKAKFAYACPEMCFCNEISSVVHCSEKGLVNIPSDIPADTKQLNLNGNSFEATTLKRINFTRYGLLEHLYLSDCNIRAIDVGTFIDLSRLKWLDLSKNRIRDLQDFTFRGLYLDQLFLNGNEQLTLNRDTFSGLRARGVFLHSCGLHEVDLETFRPINGTLRSLTLDNNHIRKIGREMQYIFASLTHLRLHTNPLHCNCEQSWLKSFYDNKPDIFKGAQAPTCKTPSLINGKAFSRLTPRDFRCQAPIFNNVDLMLANDEGVLRCAASGDPAPTLYWIKPGGERNAYPPPGGLVPVRTDAKLTITHVDGVYSGSYHCLALNAGGNVTLTMNVTWPRIVRKTIVKYLEREPAVTAAPLPLPNSPPNNPSSQNEITVEDFKIFTMLELVSAVLGTFVSTVLVSVIIFHLLFRVRSSRFHRNRFEGPYSPNTSVYTARSSDEDYMKDAVYSRPR